MVSSEDSDGLIAQTAIGQGETQMTPFMLNMLTASIANEGVLYTPYLVDRTTDAEGNQIEKNLPKLWGKVLEANEALYLEELMGYVTAYGTASELWHNACEIYGKTGTAQTSSDLDKTNAWFVGYAEYEGKEIAIAVVVEDSGSGSTYAVPIAKKVFDVYFK